WHMALYACYNIGPRTRKRAKIKTLIIERGYVVTLLILQFGQNYVGITFGVDAANDGRHDGKVKAGAAGRKFCGPGRWGAIAVCAQEGELVAVVFDKEWSHRPGFVCAATIDGQAFFVINFKRDERVF